MEALQLTLPIVIYFLLIILIIIAIVLGIKLIMTVNKVDKILDDVNEKMESVGEIFNIIDFVTGKINAISETIFGAITGAISKVFKKINKESEFDE